MSEISVRRESAARTEHWTTTCSAAATGKSRGSERPSCPYHVTYLQVVNTDVRKSVKQTLTVAVRVSVPVNPVPDPKPETPHLITRSLYGLGFKGSGFRE